jgi:O-antigen/teichoic acid export membrane protein
LLNALGASDFGIFNVVGGAIAMLGFLNAAMASATQRFMSYSEGEGNKNKQKSIFNISVILHFFIAIIAGVVLLIAGHFFFNGILKIPEDRVHTSHIIYYCMIISTMFTVMTVPYDAVLNAHENMLYYAIIGIIESGLKLGAAFIVVYTLQDKLIMYGVLMAAISLLIMLIMRIYCHRKYTECIFSPKRYYDKKLMREMTGFAGWNLLAASSGIITQYGLSIVLNSFWGTILNAAQGIANQISGQLMVFSNMMMKALNPVIVKSEGGGNRQLMLNTAMIGAKTSFFLLALFAVPFIIEAPFILEKWLKNVPEWAVLFTRLQLLRFLLEQCTIMIGGTISAQGDIKGYTTVRSFVNFLPIILTALMFYRGYPPYYMYINWIICWSIIGGGIVLYFAHKKCGLPYWRYFKRVLLPALVISILMIGIGTSISLLMEKGIVRLAAVSITTSITLILLYYCFFMPAEEKVILKNLNTSIKTNIKKNVTFKVRFND